MLSRLIQKSSKIVPTFIKRKIAFKYIAGEKLRDAIDVSRNLNKIGVCTTIDTLGEFESEPTNYITNRQKSEDALMEISKANLDSNLSVKLTNYGLGVDNNICYSHISHLLRYAEDKNIFIWLDMENSPFTCDTINIYKRIRDNGFLNVGIAFQACLLRTQKDIETLSEYKPIVRLCKGVYKELALKEMNINIAYNSEIEIEKNYIRLMNLLFNLGCYVGIATHHDGLIFESKEIIRKRGLVSGVHYEFQMLNGVKENLRNRLINEGHRVLVYVPYGEKWDGYTSRRMQENPDIAKHVFKVFFYSLFNWKKFLN
ncbi:MAG: proline dehydrogenase family protein [Candidatus Kapabacteria bacterium]|nr:proline dehydrogenase family protein [Candidatus Kapabacteria bacterium]